MVQYSGFDVSFSSTSLKIAAEINASTFFSGSNTTSGIAVLFDAILRTTEYSVRTLPGGFRYCVQSGIGVRIALRMLDVQGDIATSFAAVAAQTHLGMAKTQYKIDGLGLSPEVINALFAIDESGELTENSFRALTEALTVVLPDYLSPPAPGKHPELEPRQYTTPLPSGDDDPRIRARGINYAMSMAAARTPLEIASKKKNRPAGVSKDLIAYVYAQVARGGAFDPKSKLDEAAAKRASQWLARGRIA